MAAMDATTTSGGGKSAVTPNFYVGGGFVPNDDEFGNFMLSSMALTAADMTLEAFANTRSQTMAPKDVPRGASSNLDPQRSEGSWQARLPESFYLGVLVPTSSMVPPSRVEAPATKTTHKGSPNEEASKVVCEAATLVCQASLFFATMMSHVDFNLAVVFKMTAIMCESGDSTIANVLETEIEAEQGHEHTVEGLLSAAIHVKTMPARPVIEKSSIIPEVVVVDNSQSIFQLVGPKGKVFVPQRVLLDLGAQSLMFGTSAIERCEPPSLYLMF
jgi:hypothetical protein